MAEERIPITYSFDPKTKEIRRKKGKGDEIIEDKVVASYDPETQTVTYPSTNYRRLYKVGIITFLAENEMQIRSYAQEDLPADPPLTKAIPPRPKKNRHEGDKTPAVAQWYYNHKPSEFKVRYGYLGMYTGPVAILEPQWVPRPVDRALEYRGVVRVERDVANVIVAERSVCGLAPDGKSEGQRLTYIPDECLNWDGEDPETEEQERGVLTGKRPTEGGEE